LTFVFWEGSYFFGLFWFFLTSLPIRCKFPGTQFILGLLQFVFSLFQFTLHFEEKQVDGRVHHGRSQLGGARLLDLLEVLDLGLRGSEGKGRQYNHNTGPHTLFRLIN